MSDFKHVTATTIDNPFDPFEDFSNWFVYDNSKGYDTLSHLARVAPTSESLTDRENNEIIEHAVDEMVSLFPGIFKKFVEGDKVEPMPIVFEFPVVQSESENDAVNDEQTE